MVKLQILLLLILLYPYVLLGKPLLYVELKKPAVELGKPVYLKIIAEDLTSELSALSLEPLKKDFALDTTDIYKEKVQQRRINEGKESSVEIIRQTLSLKLYPRLTGDLLIPAFIIGKASSTAKQLLVRDASTDGSKITLDWMLTSPEVWQREQILLSLTLTTPERYATIKLAKANPGDVEVTPLPVKRKWTEHQQGGISTLSAGWSILPLKSGSLDIEIPAIEYHLSGVVRRNFYLPVIKTDIKPLPSYLPPTMPVGKIEISSSITPTGMLNTGELAYWNVEVESQSLTPYWLPPLLRQIKTDDSTYFFPATSNRSILPDLQGVHGRVDHHIPFKPLKNGFTDLPLLKIQYFDPATSRIETVLHYADRPLSLSWTLRYLAVTILIAMSLYLLGLLYRQLHKRYQYRKEYLLALHAIRQAKTLDDVLLGLRLVAKAERWPDNLTLTEWLKRWSINYQSEPHLDSIILSLSCAYYGMDKALKDFNGTQCDEKCLIENLTQLLGSRQKINRRIN